MVSAPTTMRGYVDDQLAMSWDSLVSDTADTVPDLLWPTSTETYRQMRRHPQLASVLAAYGLPLRRSPWTLNPAGCRDEVVQLVADDLGLPIAGRDEPTAARVRGVSWAEHLRLALLSLPYGHIGFEQLAQVRDGKARLVELSERLPTTIAEIHVDKVGRFAGVTQYMYTGKRSPQLRAEHMVWYAREREGAAWWGQSLLRPAYPAWLLSREMLRVAATGHRRFSVGVPTGEWDAGVLPTPEQHVALQQAMSSARVGETGGMALPPGAHMKLVGLSGSVPDTLAFLRYLDNVMVKMALAGFLDLGTTETGSRALAGEFIDLFLLAIQAEADSIADTATRQAAARIVEWNFGLDEPVPSVQVSDVGTRHEVTAEALNLLLGSGALTADPALEAHIRKRYKLPEREAMIQPAPFVAGDTLTAANPLPGAVPATAASTDGGLVAAALAAADARNWGALDETATQMQTREAAAPAPDVELPSHWAAAADDTGQDWRAEAKLARGADVPSAWTSVFDTTDNDAVMRGFDIWLADRQLAGDRAPATVEDFKALMTAAAAPALTLDLDNRVVAVAVRIGRFQAVIGQPASSCPYVGVDAEHTALRRVWLTGYLRVRPASAAPAVGDPAGTTSDPATATPPPAGGKVQAARRVRAAAGGHPGSCAHATLGSVCHCECCGVRHSWIGGDIPSGVKAPPSTPVLDGLSGFKAPAGLSGEKAPAPETPEPDAPGPEPAPTPQQEPPPAEPVDPRGYSDRAESALTEVAARQSTPLSRRRTGDRALTEDETDVLEEYMGNGFLPVNHLLRGGDPSELDRWDHGRDAPLTEDLVNSWTGAIDELMAESRLPEPVIVWRGMRNGDTLFGDAFDDDLEGAEWSDAAFSSTSSDETIANDFALNELGESLPGSTVMHVLVPAGTGALELSDELYESEVLLDRGQRFRVVNDWGINEFGVRVLDVEVIPVGR